MSHIISDEQIRDLVLGRVSTHESIQLQHHIFTCPDCLHTLIEMMYIQEWEGFALESPGEMDNGKPLSFVHDTADGWVYGSVEYFRGKWVGRHWGDQLDGIRECATLREANEYVVQSFREMFPEHRCTEKCRWDGNSKR